ncbi:unnamed protein product, partial [Owenia fusiformis]
VGDLTGSANAGGLLLVVMPDRATPEMPRGWPWLVAEDTRSTSSYHILYNGAVIGPTQHLGHAFRALFGLYYILDLSYPPFIGKATAQEDLKVVRRKARGILNYL